MARKVIGPAGSRRRRWAFLLCLVVTVGAGIMFIPGALAVHDTGAFELDGNAVNNPAVNGDDWDNVCHQVVGSDCSTTSNTSGATAVSWSAEPNPNSTIFTGGGSKDPQDVSDWAWKDGAGGLPDKDNLQHSFAARYSLPPSPTCPSGTATTCEVLFFGSDRIDNSGDAQQGFWFFQKAVGLGSNSVGGGQGFTGVHTPGDLLIISDFSNGGTTSTITVFRWDPTCKKTGGTSTLDGKPCGDANLAVLASSDAANCGTAGAADGFCGIVNPGPGLTTAPWPFLDKSGNTSYLNGEFYEGGVNLSLLGLGNECFSTVASESRASTSTTATLKDFVLGSFAVCGAKLTTQVSAATVPIGSSLTDNATVEVSGGSDPPAPTGSVSFFVCGPGVTECGVGGTAFDTKTLTVPPAVKDGKKYTVTSASFTPNAAGTWCFAASWPGDGNYTGPFRDDGANECFIVTPRQPAIVTSQTAGPVPLGSPITDTATLSNTAPKPDGSPAGGSITFTVFGPRADPAVAVCTGTPVFTSSAFPVSGNGTYGPASFTPTAPGTYDWIATYTGDLPNTLGVASNCGDEASVIISLQPSMNTAQSFIPNDSATITVAAGAGNLTGSVRFRLFTTALCSGATLIDQTVPVSGPSPQTVTTTNTTVTVSTTQHNLSWLVEFTSTNQGHKNVTSSCHNENSDLTINNGVTSNTP